MKHSHDAQVSIDHSPYSKDAYIAAIFFIKASLRAIVGWHGLDPTTNW